MKEYASYKDLVGSAESHLEFLRLVADEIDSPSGHVAAPLYERLAKTVKVGGAKFSQAKHLVELESGSDNWDFDEISDAVKVEIVQLSKMITTMDKGYDLVHFTTGYEMMTTDLKDRGISVDPVKVQQPAKQAAYSSPEP